MVNLTSTPEELLQQIHELQVQVKSSNQTIVALKRQLVGVCLHKISTYYPDASGNNGAFYECDACEAYSKYGFPNAIVRGR